MARLPPATYDYGSDEEEELDEEELDEVRRGCLARPRAAPAHAQGASRRP